MKINMDQFKWMRSLGNASYIIGIAFLIASLLVSAIPPQSVIASKEINKDVCPNIDGEQETIPDGMYLDKKEDCVPIPPPPTDVCPNIEGIQETIPDGMQLDKKGDCMLIPPPPDYKLNLSHIECVEGSVEIHFVLLNVPDGITPGTITFTYGTISPYKDTGNVWHYSDYNPEGYYNVINASVDVGGIIVTLHNPGDYSGSYFCGRTITATNTPTPTSTKEGEGTICHVDSQGDNPANFNILSLPLQAIYAGHISENGMPIAGHEQDFFIYNQEDAARCAPPTPTATPTNTPTFTGTSTPTITSTFHDPFGLEFYCTGFTVINKNDFLASYEWNINGGPSGTGELQPFGSFSSDTAYYPGVVSLYSGGQLMAAGYLPTDCGEQNTPTPPVSTPRTPAPSRTPHDPTKVVKTLIPPITTTPDILIPVTGVAGSNSLPRMLFSLGLGFLGLGFVMNGMSRRRKDLDF